VSRRGRVDAARGRSRALAVMRGNIQHKDVWLIDLDTGIERQLTALSDEFTIRDFDLSADGREMVVDRVQEHSDVVMIDRKSP